MRLLKFEATWCNTCKALDKELDKLIGIEVEHIDIDEDKAEALVDRYSIRSLPTTLILDDSGEVLHRFNGLVKASEIQETYNKLNDGTR